MDVPSATCTLPPARVRLILIENAIAVRRTKHRIGAFDSAHATGHVDNTSALRE